MRKRKGAAVVPIWGSLTKPDNLSADQIRLVDLLLSGQTVTAAAAALGISRETVYQWLRLPAVAEAIRSAKQDLRSGIGAGAEQAREAAIGATTAAISTMGLPGAELARRLAKNPKALGRMKIGQLIQLVVQCSRALPGLLDARMAAYGDVGARSVTAAEASAEAQRLANEAERLRQDGEYQDMLKRALAMGGDDETAAG